MHITLRGLRVVDVGIIYPILGKVLFQISFTNYENILAHNRYVSVQNTRLAPPLRVCHTRLVNSRKYCLNLDGIWITRCNDSVACHSIMFKEPFGSITVKFDGMLCLFWGCICRLPKRRPAELHKPCLACAFRVCCRDVASHYCWYLGLRILLMCTLKSC